MKDPKLTSTNKQPIPKYGNKPLPKNKSKESTPKLGGMTPAKKPIPKYGELSSSLGVNKPLPKNKSITKKESTPKPPKNMQTPTRRTLGKKK